MSLEHQTQSRYDRIILKSAELSLIIYILYKT